MKRTSGSMATVMLGAAAVTAGFVASKATRDALFLTSLGFSAIPSMLIATSALSILLVALYGRMARRISPSVLVPALFLASGVLFLCEWIARAAAPSTTAVIVYLHVSASGPLLLSGFWLMASERFDPRTAKARFGQIAAAGTLGSMLGALLSERVATAWGVPAMFLFLAAFQFLAAWLIRMLGYPGGMVASLPSAEAVAEPARPHSGLRVVADAPHLRHLALLVLLGTTGAALLEYLFKARAVETFGPGDHLLRFFALYYAATSLVTFILQTLSGRVLERFGLALATSTPSIALLAGCIGNLLAPGFGSLMVARGGESMFRGSWYRSGYELFYTPIPAVEKRAGKSVIDVIFDRLGDAVGGGLIRLVVLLAPAAHSSTILSLAMASSVGAIIAASRLNRWYISTLEQSLVNQAGGLHTADTEEGWTRSLLLRIQRKDDRTTEVRQEATRTALRTVSVDPELQDIVALRSMSRGRAIEVLSAEEGLSASLVPHAIALLASDRFADYALFALRKVAEERVGELIDALLDPNQGEVVRVRLARVLAGCVSQRAADGLVLALDDPQFEVRFQSAQSLKAILDRNPRVRVDRDRIQAVILQEPPETSLAHVFALLSLMLPREPVQIALRSLESEDSFLRGTALEYLEGVLPAPIRQRLWPLLLARSQEKERIAEFQAA